MMTAGTSRNLARLLTFLAVAGTTSIVAHAADEMAPFKGVPIIEDVDSFWVAGAHIRLNGVDGPEITKNSKAGNEATRYFYELTRGKTLTCTWNGDMNRGRFVAICTLPDSRDLGDTIIRAGYGRDCMRYSGGRYAQAEQEAKANRRGLWASGLMPEKVAGYC